MLTEFYLIHSYVVRLQVFIADVVASSSGTSPEVSSATWLLQQFFMVSKTIPVPRDSESE